MNSGAFAVRVDAINIYDNILDNNQLSVVRGGGLLLRDAILRLDDWGRSERTWSNWTRISAGASVGIFQLFCSSETAQSIEARIAAWITSDEYYEHFTFAVAALDLKGTSATEQEAEALLAKLRWMQQMQPSIPLEADCGSSAEICSVTRIRPALPGASVRDQPCSQSVKMRFAAGRAAKVGGNGADRLADFYLKETAVEAHATLQDLRFALDMSDIASDPSRGTLHNKVAIFYADGNRFSAIVRAAKNLPELTAANGNRWSPLAALDQDLLTKRQALLADLIRWADLAPGMSFGIDRTGRKGLRLEVLLWGGDELILVVPAWEGFALLQRFFAHTANWRPELRNPAGEIDTATTEMLTACLAEPAPGKRALSSAGHMTHAAGLLFAHAKTPIHVLRRLAQELADACKHDMQVQPENAFQTLALESIDYPAEPLDSFYSKHLPGTLSEPSRTLRAPYPSTAASDPLKVLREALQCTPRSQVYALVETIIEQAMKPTQVATDQVPKAIPDPVVIKQVARLAQMLRDAVPDNAAKTLRGGLEAMLWPHEARDCEPSLEGIPPFVWIQLQELWDYLVAVSGGAAKPGSALIAEQSV